MKETNMKCCVTIECYEYPVAADVSYNNLVKSTTHDHLPCEQYAVSALYMFQETQNESSYHLNNKCSRKPKICPNATPYHVTE